MKKSKKRDRNEGQIFLDVSVRRLLSDSSTQQALAAQIPHAIYEAYVVALQRRPRTLPSQRAVVKCLWAPGTSSRLLTWHCIPRMFAYHFTFLRCFAIINHLALMLPGAVLSLRSVSIWLHVPVCCLKRCCDRTKQRI